MSWWRSHSVRVRLTLWYVAAMTVVLGVYVFAVYAFVDRSIADTVDEQLRDDIYWVTASLYQTPDGSVMFNEPEQLAAEAEAPWVQVWEADGSDLLYRNAEAIRREVPQSQSISAEGIATIPTETVPMRILTQRHDFLARRGSLFDQRVIVQVGRSEEPLRARLRELVLILLGGLPVAVAVAGLGGYALARRALAPIERMTERARTITAARLSDRLPVHNPEDEMGRLAAVFNETLARLEASFGQMRRFTADVSHELRTPLTAIRSVGEVGLRGQRDEAAYRRIIGSMLEESDRLASLVDRLLTLSRAETRQSKPATEAVDLRELADHVIAQLGVLAEEKRQTLTVESHGTPQALGDREVLSQALINLVDNAIKFTPAGGQIRIRVAEVAGEAVCEVSDSGPGVAPAAQPRIFDRFYREEGIQAGGTGLGLSIARGAVEANGGRLTLERTDPGGSTFRIAMPRPPTAHRRAG
jgi:heavy metal sensor kinase